MMYPSDLLHDVIRYGLVVSALLLALVCYGYGRGGAGRGYLWLSAALVLDGLRHLLVVVLPPSVSLSLYMELDQLLRAFLLFSGVRLLGGGVLPAALRWLLPLVLGWLLWSHLFQQQESHWHALPGTILLSSAYFLLAMFFWRARDRNQPLGFLLAASGAVLLSILCVVQPVALKSDWGVWHFSSFQMLYLMISGGLIMALYQSERLRADFASEGQHKALLRVLRSRRRVVQLREWTDVLLQQISDGVVVTDMDGLITGFNRGAEKIFGLRAADLLGKPVTELMPEHIRPVDISLTQMLRDLHRHFREPTEGIGRFHDGTRLELEMVVSPMAFSDAEQMVAIIRDVSERKRQREQLHFMARHDALTGLPNRRCFTELVTPRLAAGQTGMLAFVDLDDFKLINDTLGHKAGDTALVAIARRLVSLAGEHAVVARQSGDEFVLFVPGMTDTTQMRNWAEALVARVRSPVSFDQVEFGLSCSVGLAPCVDSNADVETLVREADLAMYQAKRSGKNRFSFFHESMLAEFNRVAELAARLKRMNMDEELSLVFQPRMQLEDRQLAGAEVLLRWRTPEGEQIPPAQFIPVAEETGQILRLGYWVLEHACRHLAGWGHLRDSMVLSINLSARQLFDENLVDRIEEVRTRYDLSPAQLEFEITESSAMQDIDYALRVLGRLRARGYGLSLDDFGTGFSSLSHMRQLPVDTIKIDQSFVQNLVSDRQQRVLVAGIIELTGHLGMRVLAEGVETIEQLEILDSLGCDEAQGYLIGRPMASQDFCQRVLSDWEELTEAF
ncbi:MAG: EAL domain-containing protein [Alcanivoracaceae bacterium]|jgi:diguanylate cyclase (GGDEF)-like protein/PAS domain S-box-containing protein|nr:EAL domain-containing protein [Alcanivoracaceae bacterium]